MGKHIQTVATLAERAERRGTAVVRGQEGLYGAYTFGMTKEQILDMFPVTEKYRVNVENGVAELIHWGTTTAKIDLDKKEVLEIYGESQTDANSIETFLSYFGIDGVYCGFKPSKGGFYISTNEANYYYEETPESEILEAINSMNKVA